MSGSFTAEPAPGARITLQTTCGNIDVELWTKESPKASRNFVQLCLEGYYDNTIFHRIVKGFIVQGGDPTGTGNGGQSIWDAPFEDEFHSRLRFSRRGLLAMANSGKDDNGSQFFFTLAATPELQGKNTIFGRVEVGDSIYTVANIAEKEIDENGRPIYPITIMTTIVQYHPFDDIKPRTTARDRQEQFQRQAEQANQHQIEKARKRKPQLMSFIDEEDADGCVAKILNLRPKRSKNAERQIESPPPDSNIGQKLENKQQSDNEEVVKPTREQMIAETNAQIEALKQSIRASRKKPVSEARNGSINGEELSKAKLFAQKREEEYVHSKRAMKANRKKLKGMETEVLAKLSAFASKVTKSDVSATLSAQIEMDESQICELHNVPGCYSCFDRLGERDDIADDPAALYSHQLTFSKDRLGKDLEWRKAMDDGLDVIDPREKTREIVGNRKKNISKVWLSDRHHA